MKRKHPDPPPRGFVGLYRHFDYQVSDKLSVQFFVCHLRPSNKVSLDLNILFGSQVEELTKTVEYSEWQFVESIMLKPKGKLGDYVKKYHIDGKNLEVNKKYTSHDIGSMTFKLASSTGTKVSVFIYSNGKIKISGGGVEFDKLEESVYNIWKVIYDLFVWDFEMFNDECPDYTEGPVICNISSSYSVGEIKGNWPSKTYKIYSSGLFNRVVLPTFELEGRSAAIQCYVYPRRKASLIFDQKGKVHLLGFKNKQELKYAQSLVNRCLSN